MADRSKLFPSPDKYKARAATWADTPAIVHLLNASSRSTRGTDVTAVHWQKRHFKPIKVKGDALYQFNSFFDWNIKAHHLKKSTY